MFKSFTDHFAWLCRRSGPLSSQPILREKFCPFIFILSICVHLIAEQRMCSRVIYTRIYTPHSRTGFFVRSSHKMHETNSQSGGVVLVYLFITHYISPKLLLFVVVSCCVYYKYCVVIFLFLLWKNNNYFIQVFWCMTPCRSMQLRKNLHGIISQKTWFFINTAVRTSNIG